MTTTIKFPKTDLVQCVFSFRSSSNTNHVMVENWDEYDHHMHPKNLKPYTYRVPEHLQGKLAVGDAVLVHCQTGYQICEVIEINALSFYDSETYAPVVCKVDLGTYIEEIEKAKQLQIMRAAIDREKARLESIVGYEIIAEKNPEFKAMLEQFKSMGGVL